MSFSLPGFIVASLLILSAISAHADVEGMLSESATHKVEYVTTEGSLEIRLTGFETMESLIVTRFFPRQTSNVSSYLSALLGDQIPLNAVSDMFPQGAKVASIKLAIFKADHNMQYPSHFTGETVSVPHLNIARTYVTGSEGQAVQVFVVELLHPTLFTDAEVKQFNKGQLNVKIATQAHLSNSSESTVKATEITVKTLNQNVMLGSSFAGVFQISCRQVLQ